MFGGTWEWLIVLVLAVLLFGRGKIAGIMGEVATGIKSFKKGMADDDDEGAQDKTARTQKTIDHAPADKVETMSAATEEQRKA